MKTLAFAAATAAVVGCAGFAQAAESCKAEAVHRPAPSFDSSGLENRDHWATIVYRVDAEGRTTEVRLKEADAAERFSAAAVKAVKNWRFDAESCALDKARVREVTLRYWPVAGRSYRVAVNPDLPTGEAVGEGDASPAPVMVDSKLRYEAHRQGKLHESSRNDEPGYVLGGVR